MDVASIIANENIEKHLMILFLHSSLHFAMNCIKNTTTGKEISD